MSQPLSANALPDARAFLNRVLKAKKGLKITFPSFEKAFAFRMRCYTVKSRELARNKKVYSEKDPDYNQTIWDEISLYLEKQSDGTCKVSARHDENIAGALGIEEIE